MVTHIPNSVPLKKVLIGTETIPGTPVTPTARLLGEFSATTTRELSTTPESTGLFMRQATPRRQAATHAGNYTNPELSFEEFAQLLKYSVRGGVSGVDDTETTNGYTYTFSPNLTADAIDTMTVQDGVDGMGFQTAGVRFGEFNLAADAVSTDSFLAWSGTLFHRGRTRLPGYETGIATGGTTSTVVMTSAGWSVNEWQGAYVYIDYGTHIGEVRQVASNTADTLTLSAPVLANAVSTSDVFHLSGLFPVVANPVNEAITIEGSKLFLDIYNPSASSAGTTDVSERVLSLNVTQQLNLNEKRRLPGVIGRVDRGETLLTGTIRFEADRWDEYKAWEENTELSIRWEKIGSVIDATATPNPTTKLARLDIERALVNTITEDADNNNITHSVSFMAYLPASAPPYTFTVKTKQATLA